MISVATLASRKFFMAYDYASGVFHTVKSTLASTHTSCPGGVPGRHLLNSVCLTSKEQKLAKWTQASLELWLAERSILLKGIQFPRRKSFPVVHISPTSYFIPNIYAFLCYLLSNHSKCVAKTVLHQR